MSRIQIISLTRNNSIEKKNLADCSCGGAEFLMGLLNYAYMVFGSRIGTISKFSHSNHDSNKSMILAFNDVYFHYLTSYFHRIKENLPIGHLRYVFLLL